MAIAHLRRVLLPPNSPTEVPSDEDWLKACAALGLELPLDYFEFLRAYGTGIVDGFLFGYNPGSANKQLALVPRVKLVASVLETAKEAKRLSFSTYPSRPGLVPWGATENGDTLTWFTEGSPDEWPVIALASRGTEWLRFDGSVTDFLELLLERKLRCPFFPADFPTADRNFKSW